MIAVICLYVVIRKMDYISQQIKFLISNKDIPILDPVSLQFREFYFMILFISQNTKQNTKDFEQKQTPLKIVVKIRCYHP